MALLCIPLSELVSFAFSTIPICPFLILSFTCYSMCICGTFSDDILFCVLHCLSVCVWGWGGGRGEKLETRLTTFGMGACIIIVRHTQCWKVIMA